MVIPMQAVLSDHSRALKKPASFVLTSLGPSTYPRGYASGPRSLRPRWTVFLNTLMIPFLSEVFLQSVKFQQPSVV